MLLTDASWRESVETLENMVGAPGLSAMRATVTQAVTIRGRMDIRVLAARQEQPAANAEKALLLLL